MLDREDTALDKVLDLRGRNTHTYTFLPSLQDLDSLLCFVCQCPFFIELHFIVLCNLNFFFLQDKATICEAPLLGVEKQKTQITGESNSWTIFDFIAAIDEMSLKFKKRNERKSALK